MMKNKDNMKNIDDMKIGESFYLKWTVAKISERTNTPCEYDEERIDVNAIIIEELESIKTDIDEMLKSDEVVENKFSNVIINKSYLFKSIINKHIAELKGE